MAVNGFTHEARVVILSAGLGTRMRGTEKGQLMWPPGGTLLERQERMCRRAGFVSLAVCRGPGPNRVMNPFPERGLSESIKRGVQAVRRRWGPVDVGILLVDQPFVMEEDLRGVYQAFRSRPPHIHAMRPLYGGVAGHPVFFDRTWDEVVERLQGDRGLGGLWHGRRDVQSIEMEVRGRPAPDFDIDTQDAYAKALLFTQGGDNDDGEL